MESILLLLTVGFLIEAVVETLRLTWDEASRKISIPVVLSLIAGLAFAWALQINIFKVLSISDTAPGWFGYSATGILISRGSNFIHDLWVRMNTKTL